MQANWPNLAGTLLTATRLQSYNIKFAYSLKTVVFAYLCIDVFASQLKVITLNYYAIQGICG